MLPERVNRIISQLNEGGYKAYAVGGCVRDILRGTEPSDFDIATSALPHQIKQVFAHLRTVDTGIAHGTVTVIDEGIPYEVTTFRTDGVYTDSRHPESVSFTAEIQEDLARRDFTVNSMAMGSNGEIIDLYGGARDLEQGIIRCTGEASVRFSEDALRIMRALRFSSVLGFEIEGETAAAIHEKKGLLADISVERIFTEFKKLLCGKDAERILTQFSDVICTVIPELKAAVGFYQKDSAAGSDLYCHLARAVAEAEPEPVLRLAALLHDVGLPCAHLDGGAEDEAACREHSSLSARLAYSVLERLNCDTVTKETVSLLCSWHDCALPTNEIQVKKLFLSLSYSQIVLLCKLRLALCRVRDADTSACGDDVLLVLRSAEKIVAEDQCVSVSALKVNGHDMLALGYKGAQIGEILNRILLNVIENNLPNERASQLSFAEKLAGEL